MPRCFLVAARMVIALIALGVCAVGAGCGRDKARRDDPVHVLATVYAMADIVRQVGGDHVSTEWYVEDGQSLGELVETPERRAQFRSAELVITRGAPDAWTLEGAGDPYQDRKILRIDALPSTRDADPLQYLWLDPRTAIEMADEVAARLSALRPRHEKQFKANAAEFDRKVADLMEQTSATMNRTIGGGGAMITLDRGFLPLGRRFGLEEVKFSPIPPTQANEYYTRHLRMLARDSGAGVIFLNAEAPSPLVRDWQSRLHLAALTLDSMGSSSPTGRSTYLAVLKYNLAQLNIAASRARPTTATTRYLAETTDPSENAPPPPPPSTAPQEEIPTPPLPVPANSSDIRVQPIPNPFAGMAQRTGASAPTTRPAGANPRGTRTIAPAPTGGSGIRVAPPRLAPSFEPTSRPHPATLPALDNPFGR